MAFEYTRNLKDANFIQPKACPAAGATNYSTAFDLEQVTGGNIEEVQVEVAIPATPSLADTKTLTITMQDSADNSTFADCDPAITTSVLGVSSAGAAAKTVRARLNPAVRRYVRFAQVVSSSGGDNTAVSVTYSLIF